MSGSSTQEDLDDGDRQDEGGHVDDVEKRNVIDTATSFKVNDVAGAFSNKSTPHPDPLPPTSTPGRMSVLTLPMPDVALHSPSNIVGTPFATDSTPYEYPFPDGSTAKTDRDVQPFSSSTTSLSLSPSFSRSSFPISSSSSSQLPTLSTSPPSISSLTHFPPDLSQKYSPTHPKLRQGSPPVPPALVKKRQRWSLGLLRRRSSSGSSSNAGQLTSPEVLSDTTSERASYPLRLSRTPEVVTIDSQRQQKTVEESTKVQRPD